MFAFSVYICYSRRRCTKQKKRGLKFMLELKNLHFTVSDENGEKHILNGVDLAIEDKRFVVITGPNGGGKTTLARKSPLLIFDEP